MAGVIAQRILRHRKKLKVTQDQLGADYNVSGPAVFKFEKGYVVPSLRLWLRLADDMNIDRRTAVLMYVQDRLPEQYKNYARWDSMVAEGGLKGPEYEDFAVEDRDKLKAIINIVFGGSPTANVTASVSPQPPQLGEGKVLNWSGRPQQCV